MSKVQIRKALAKNDNEMIYVKTPYSSEFVKGAWDLNGSWIARQQEWAFDPRDIERVRELCRNVYGVDDINVAPELVTVRLHLDTLYSDYRQSLELFGRTIARRPGRDSRVQMDSSVVVIAGGFPANGGSAKNPALKEEAGTILEVRDVPASLVRVEDYPEGSIEIIESVKKIDRQALEAEADAIRKRLKEIMGILETVV